MSRQENKIPFSVQSCESGSCITLQFGVASIHLHRDDFELLLRRGWEELSRADTLNLMAKGQVEDSRYEGLLKN